MGPFTSYLVYLICLAVLLLLLLSSFGSLLVVYCWLRWCVVFVCSAASCFRRCG